MWTEDCICRDCKAEGAHMEWSVKTIDGYELRVLRADAVVVGSGAAGLNAAE